MGAVPANSPTQAAHARDYEAARNAYGRSLALGMGGRIAREDGVEVLTAPLLHPYLGWISPCPAPGTAANALSTAIRLHRTGGTTHGLTVNLCASSAPADAELRAALRENGFRCVYHVPVLHRDLREPIAVLPPPAGYSLLHEPDPAQAVARAQKPLPPPIGAARTSLQRSRLSHLASFTTGPAARGACFLAWHGATAAGITVVDRHLDIALVIDVHVVPGHRRRGLGAALVSAACAWAASMHCRCAVLSASGAGVRLYQSLGFRPAGRWSDFHRGATSFRSAGGS